MGWRAAGTLVIVAWGVLAFGAVYPWAYGPLFVACAAFGLIGLVGRPHGDVAAWPFAAALGIVALVAVVQIVPLPVDTLRWLTPETERVLRNYDVAFAVARPTPPHAVSLDPRATRLGLVALVCLALFLFGLSRSLRRRDVRHVVAGIIVLGVGLALFGLIQKALWNGKLYWFWTPQEQGESFGPFVNRNHFAGWMLMALPLAIGYFCGRVAKGVERIKPGWHNRLMWLASPDATNTMLVGFAIVVMATSLVLTFSRSGILGLMAAAIVIAFVVIRRQSTGVRRTVAAAYVFSIVLVALAWAGLDLVVSRFAVNAANDMDRRVGAWNDAWHIFRRFPLAGTGLNTYGVATLFYQTINLTHHYDQAHNDYLQLAAEGGALLLLPAAAALVTFCAAVRKRFAAASAASTDYWIRVGAVAGLVAIALQELGEFSLQMPGNAVMFCLLAAIVLRAPDSASRAVTLR